MPSPMPLVEPVTTADFPLNIQSLPRPFATPFLSRSSCRAVRSLPVS
jgi:hypothetical protein